MVGLTGYPNVGKSSTINALFGSKKTTVSSTPGKTKHFQTLNITPQLTLVDCPGLVLPRYAASKAEMVAAGKQQCFCHHFAHQFSTLPRKCSSLLGTSGSFSAPILLLTLCLDLASSLHITGHPMCCGRMCFKVTGWTAPTFDSHHLDISDVLNALCLAGVIPIDRLTDVRTPVAVICGKVPRPQLEQVYGVVLPPPASHESHDRPPTALEFLRALAIKRGWSSANGLPDETRAGRTILKDYTSGKLVSAEMPPGFHPENRIAMVGESFWMRNLLRWQHCLKGRTGGSFPQSLSG